MSVLTRIGIGSATIDLIPEQRTVQPGDQIGAHLELKGGASAQTVDDVEIALITRYEEEGAEGNAFWTQYGLWTSEFTDGFTIEPDADRSIDVPPIQVPSSTPVTLDTTTVWIQSALDISWAVDPADVDQIEVRPSDALKAVLDALEAPLGCRLEMVKNVETETDLTPHPFVQMFQFDGGDGPLAGALDHFTIAPIPSPDQDDLTLLLWVDRLGEREVGDVRTGQFAVQTIDVDRVAETIHDEIEKRL